MNENFSRELPNLGSAAVRGEAVAEDCGACHGSGWVVRDPDIGTDQECFSCGGSGKNDEEPEESHPAWARTILYTDTIGGKQTCRDDLWAITGDELRLFQAAQKSMGAHHDLLQVVAKAAGFTESGFLRDLPEFIAAKVSPRAADAPSEPSELAKRLRRSAQDLSGLLPNSTIVEDIFKAIALIKGMPSDGVVSDD